MLPVLTASKPLKVVFDRGTARTAWDSTPRPRPDPRNSGERDGNAAVRPPPVPARPSAPPGSERFPRGAATTAARAARTVTYIRASSVCMAGRADHAVRPGFSQRFPSLYAPRLRGSANPSKGSRHAVRHSSRPSRRRGSGRRRWPGGHLQDTEKELVAALAAGPGNADLLTSPVSIDGRHRVNVVRRTKGAGAVAHDGAMELHHIVSGTGTLVTGGTLVRPTGAGSVATIQNGVSRKVGPGDVVLIQAGEPHWYKGPRQHAHVSGSPLGRKAMTTRSLLIRCGLTSAVLIAAQSIPDRQSVSRRRPRRPAELALKAAQTLEFSTDEVDLALGDGIARRPHHRVRRVG